MTKRTSRIYDALPTAPTLSSDIAGARAYHAALVAILLRDDLTPKDYPERLTRPERARVRFLEARWLARASGADKRWNLVGARPGQLRKALAATYKPGPSPDWTRPLDHGETGTEKPKRGGT